MSRVIINGVEQGVLETQRLNETIKHLGAIYEASLKWYWRAIAVIVALATVTSAVFQVLIFFNE